MDEILAEAGLVSSNSWLDFGGDPDHGEDTGIGISTIAGKVQFNEFCGNTWHLPLAEVCGLRVFLVTVINAH